MDASLDAALHIRQLMAEILIEDYRPGRDRLPPKDFFPIVQTTDCRSLYDTLTKDGAPTLPTEKRLAVDLAALSDAADEHGWQAKDLFRWVPTNLQVADHLTKQKPPEELRAFLDVGRCQCIK